MSTIFDPNILQLIEFLLHEGMVKRRNKIKKNKIEVMGGRVTYALTKGDDSALTVRHPETPKKQQEYKRMFRKDRAQEPKDPLTYSHRAQGRNDPWLRLDRLRNIPKPNLPGTRAYAARKRLSMSLELLGHLLREGNRENKAKKNAFIAALPATRLGGSDRVSSRMKTISPAQYRAMLARSNRIGTYSNPEEARQDAKLHVGRDILSNQPSRPVGKISRLFMKTKKMKNEQYELDEGEVKRRNKAKKNAFFDKLGTEYNERNANRHMRNYQQGSGIFAAKHPRHLENAARYKEKNIRNSGRKEIRLYKSETDPYNPAEKGNKWLNSVRAGEGSKRYHQYRLMSQRHANERQGRIPLPNSFVPTGQSLTEGEVKRRNKAKKNLLFGGPKVFPVDKPGERPYPEHLKKRMWRAIERERNIDPLSQKRPGRILRLAALRNHS